MKKVMEPSQVAHFWANKIQDEARTATANLFFTGQTIYSYGHHFEIAKHVENGNNCPAVLFTERTYSNTTAKHISIVRQAARHLNILYVPAVENSPAQNFEAWARNIQHIASSLQSARKPEIYLNQIAVEVSHINDYVNFFGYEIPALLRRAMDITNKSQFIEYLNIKVAIETEEAAKRQAKEEAEHKKALKLWLSGKGYNRLYSHNGFDYLRIKDNLVQTSQGVTLEIAEARRLNAALNAGTLKIGQRILQGYTVEEISAKIVRIGCHTFKRSTITQFAKKLN